MVRVSGRNLGTARSHEGAEPSFERSRPEPARETRTATRDSFSEAKEASWELLGLTDRGELPPDELTRLATTGVSGAPGRNLALQAAVAKNRPRELAALEGLGSQGRAQYGVVQQALRTAGQVVGELALQNLLFGQVLMGAGGASLSQMSQFAQGATVADGVNRGHLLSQLVQDVASPAMVAQAPNGAFAAGVAGLQLVTWVPAQYAYLSRPDAKDRQRSPQQQLLGQAEARLGQASRQEVADAPGLGRLAVESAEVDQVLGGLLDPQAMGQLRTHRGRVRALLAQLDQHGRAEASLRHARGHRLPVEVSGLERLGGLEHLLGADAKGRPFALEAFAFARRLEEVSAHAHRFTAAEVLRYQGIPLRA
jgi:hypothetical protein